MKHPLLAHQSEAFSLYKNRGLLVFTGVFLFCSFSLLAEPGKVVPMLAWQYSYNDTGKEYTIGTAYATNPIPQGTYEPSTGYSPAQIRHAYGFDQSLFQGQGASIAVIEAYGSPNLVSDVRRFCTQYNLPPINMQIVYSNGKPTIVPGVTTEQWALETTMDVEWAHAMAPYAKIYVVESAEDSTIDNAISYAAKYIKPTVISMSLGSPDSYTGTKNDSEFLTPGNIFVASAGDYTNYVFWPAANPNVLGVGGTSLYYNVKNKTIVAEVPWLSSSNNVSSVYSLPAYQTPWIDAPGRTTPDVSYDSDPYTGYSVFFSSNYTHRAGFYLIAGTSAAAPQVAALIADRASAGNKTPLTNTKLYQSALSNYNSLFAPVTLDSDWNLQSFGYHELTGLGRVKAQAFINLR